MQSLLFVYEMASFNALLENVSIKSVPNTSIAALEAAFGFFVAIFRANAFSLPSQLYSITLPVF
jgi:hypothetical protein